MGMRMNPKVVMGNTDITGKRSFMRAYEGLESWCDSNLFGYEIAYPSRDNMTEEIMDVIREVMVDDVYRLESITNPSDCWVDIGSHVGLFSIAVMQAGASVVLAVDADKEMADCAAYTTSMFKSQSVGRGLISSNIPDPFVVNETVTSASQLIDFNFYRGSRRCLKLDIQGSEIDVFRSDNASSIADQYDLIVVEYHDANISEFSMLMENAGWFITSIVKHEDTLLNTPTHLIWAESK